MSLTGVPAALLVAAPIVAPLAASAGAAKLGWRRSVAIGTVAAALAVLAVGAGTTVWTAGGGAVEAGNWFRIDALSGVMLIVIGAVGGVAAWVGIGYLDDELATGRTTANRARWYGTLVPLFLAAMVVAVLANNLGLLWAAIEATTIVTAFLVGHGRSRKSLEATWKYVIICSVGIALAYLGTVLVNYAATQAGVVEHGTLDWTELVAHAGDLDPGVMRLAFALLVLGFGTKAGLVPLHSWLPDAHSQAPAPVSALMSGVLLPVAVYALARYRVIAVASVDPSFVRGLLLAMALMSLVLAAGLLLAQRDYKRLLAYSSIEHMALAVIGVAIGTPLAIAAALLHIVGHGLGKAVLFCGAGEILARERSTRIDAVRGLFGRTPLLAGLFATGLVALLGLPPFSLFASEVGLVRAGVDAELGWVMAVVLVLLLVVFIAISTKAAGILLGSGPPEPAAVGALRTSTVVPLAAGLVVVAVLGIVDWPLGALLLAAAEIVGTR
ncbi:proton-conducting transporter membrane subunit [Kribbella shirazensis]|uniref:Hydrogenase-4 component F n=1 Tax=Kribbella shirazensis TaxID=1105143 RepID=A0A7X5VEH4_9ACTN|nr:proton-conducting transporter membrane subunit [Kribbella shirazensis]NIK59047.1 hydrogenase-4 component F [Kribbella shirazensis]